MGNNCYQLGLDHRRGLDLAFDNIVVLSLRISELLFIISLSRSHLAGTDLASRKQAGPGGDRIHDLMRKSRVLCRLIYHAKAMHSRKELNTKSVYVLKKSFHTCNRTHNDKLLSLSISNKRRLGGGAKLSQRLL